MYFGVLLLAASGFVRCPRWIWVIPVWHPLLCLVLRFVTHVRVVGVGNTTGQTVVRHWRSCALALSAKDETPQKTASVLRIEPSFRRECY